MYRQKGPKNVEIIYYNLDLIWLPMVFVIMHKHQRWTAFGFLVSCMLVMRLQVELMEGGGFHHGILPIMQSTVFDRAAVIYNIFYIVYFVMAYFSRLSMPAVFLGASISIFFMAFFVSSLLMIL